AARGAVRLAGPGRGEGLSRRNRRRSRLSICPRVVRKRRAVVLASAGLVIVGWYSVQYQGAPRPVDPLLVSVVHRGPEWYSQPALVQKADDPGAIYVLPGQLQNGNEFNALRVE